MEFTNRNLFGLFCIFVSGFLAACSGGSTPALQTDAGQLFCAINTAGGGQIIAGIAETAAAKGGAAAEAGAVIAANASESYVQSKCAAAAAAVGAKGAIPVSPPPATATVPTVTIAATAAPMAITPGVKPLVPGEAFPK